MGLSIIFIVPLAIYTLGKFGIQKTVDELTYNETDTMVIARKIMNWEYSHMRNTYGKDIYINRLRFGHPSWIYLTRYGGCSEYAILFSELLKTADTVSMIVSAPGEDHVWTIVWINDSWEIFDPSANRSYGKPRHGLYDRPDWNLSYIIGKDYEGEKHDFTKDYTDTGKLIVKVVDQNNMPLKGARVTIESHFLVEHYNYSSELYKEPRFVLSGKNKSNHIYEFNLGGNNYTIVARAYKYGGLIGAKRTLHLWKIQKSM